MEASTTTSNATSSAAPVDFTSTAIQSQSTLTQLLAGDMKARQLMDYIMEFKVSLKLSISVNTHQSDRMQVYDMK